MARRLGIVFLSAATAACAAIAGIEDIPESDPLPALDASANEGGRDSTVPEDGASPRDGSSSDGPTLPDCPAQRVVHIVAGSGGLAWFTLVWPVPAVVAGTAPAYAIDDRSRFARASADPHPLFLRTKGGVPLWTGVGKNPLPTALVTGTNETHTNTPSSAITLGGRSVIGAGALVQASLAPKVPVIVFAPTTYSPVPTGPAGTNVTDVDSAIAAVGTAAALSPADEQAIRPDPKKLETWFAAGAPAKTTNLAQQLLLAANLFKRGLVGTVVLPAFRDDPHGAFSAGNALATATADDLAGVLAGFYAELAGTNEATCGYKGAPLSLADNVMVVVTGDTPKNPFDSAGWPDGTPGSANVMYVRSNGWMRPGWFGQLNPGGRVNFDPTSGEASASTTPAESGAAAINGVLYAMTRGNAALVAASSSAPYAGVRAPAP